MTLILRWLSRWPLAWLHALGAMLGWATWALSPSYRRRLKANAALAGLSAAQRRQSIAEAGRLVAEVPWLWFMPPDERLGERVRWQGGGLIDDALAAGRGVLLLTPHLGSFEVAARAAAERYAKPITVLYRPARKALLRKLEETARARPNMATAPASLSGVRLLLRALKRGEMVGLLPDQVPPLGQGVWAPFFGRPAYTMTLAARLAQQTGAAVLLAWCERLPGGAGYTIHLAPLDEPLPANAEDDVESARVINASMERVIRALPTQYLWGYNRYKSPRRLKPDAGG
ncbi:lysophospholipid acyltransferase family protein [Ideonella sp.]|uniref:lysophospholipid acyltransferase family protein n=1 Tax=Ideonella sp. TaxID=1929293 RepID=UPI0035B113D3